MVVIGKEKALIENNYDCIKCTIINGILYCYGEYQPTKYSITYSYRIKYKPYSTPISTVTSPIIEYDDDIHMYPKDNSLCLYHKTDMIWDSQEHHLYDTIIPWIHEWFVFYELYLFKGKWLHPYVAHKRNKKSA